MQFKGEGLKKPKSWFGGAYLKNSHAKTKRPLSSKLPLHVVLRAKRSGMRQPHVFGKVNGVVHKTCAKYGVRLYDYVNVGNHLHLLVKLPHIRLWAPFVRELTGQIAQLFPNGTTYFKQRPFSRIVGGWRRAYRIARDYIELNRLEAAGFISRREIKTLRDLRDTIDPA